MWARKIPRVLLKSTGISLETASSNNKNNTRSMSAIATLVSAPRSTPTPASIPASPQLPFRTERGQQQQQQQQQQFTRIRSYVSRAHPKPIPEFSVPIGLQMVLDGVEERKKQRAAKWDQNRDKRRGKGIEVSRLGRGLVFRMYHSRKPRVVLSISCVLVVWFRVELS